MRAAFSFLAISGVVLLGGRHADAQVHKGAVPCVRTAEEGQRARAAGKLRDARDRFQSCVSDACPALVRQDCGLWASEVTAMVPTIVVDARDAAGHDVADVLVRVDGEVIATKLDGKTLAVDPGPHTLTFERIGFEPVSEKAIIKEGIKARAFVVSFTTPRAAAAAVEDAPAPARAPESAHTVWPWLVVAGGGAIATVGVVFVATAPTLVDCIGGDRECIDAQNRAVVSREEHFVRGGILIGAGVIVIAGGLLWHFLEPAGPARSAARARFVPWTTATGGGMAAVGTF